jgi:hypothetical protein
MKHLFLIVALLMAFFAVLNAEQVTVSSHSNEIRLIQSTPDNMVLELTLGQFNRETVQIQGETWYHLNLKKEGLTLDMGLPQVPVMAGSVIIPNTAQMSLQTTSSEYVELNMPVAPSKGNLTRDIDPDTVPYTFDEFYNGTDPYPAEQAYLTEPFILRDYRGITVRFQPFQYYPQTGVLRVYTKLQIELSNTGTDLTNSLSVPKNSTSPEFADIYENMFLNFAQAKYPSLGESGRILVIKNAMFDAAIQPWVDWKRQNGYQVDIVDVTVAGPTATQIQTYIQGQYNQNNNLMFVQIMGDAPQVPTLTSGGGGSDPSFALLAGGDSYPDIYVGRFSAQTVAEMQTQVQRSVHYERDLQTSNQWVQRGMGIASNEGGGSQGDMGESDQVHMDNIRTDLLNFGYLSVDQMYQSAGATAAQVSANVNAGRGFINYCGHGSATSWVTTGFNVSNVNALVNDNMLPFIVSVACVNGNFVSQTCFAEAWLRSVNETTNNPAGAIAMYASTINQGWNPPMRGQDEVTDLLVGQQKRTVGGLLFNGSSKMIEVYGTSGISEYKCWTIFGDASLMVRTKDPEPLTATYNPVFLMGMTSFSVVTVPDARVTLSANGTVYGFAIADAAGNATITFANPPAQPMDLTLVITAYNKVTHIGTVQVLPATGPYILVDGITVTDNNNNLPEYGETITLNVSMENVGSDAAQGVIVYVSSPDPYLTILTAQEAIGDIAANATGSTNNGISIQIANNVPDQHIAPIHVMVNLSNDEVFEYNGSITLNAPAFGWGAYQVNDTDGNNNGRIDAGETILLTIPIINTGHSQINDLIGALIINDLPHVMEAVQTTFGAVPAGGQVQMIYEVTFSSQIPVGTVVPVTTLVFGGEYSGSNVYSVTIGLVVENFENGFGGFGWAFTGGNWTTEGGSHDNSMAAKSATITHNQSTSMTVTLHCPAAGEVTFWKKVSSEQSYDHLKFFLNGVLKNQWSGTTDTWTLESFATPAGMNVFTWQYSKDSMVTAGSDCAWIDDIIFPATGGTSGAPAIIVPATIVDFPQVLLGDSATQAITVSNSGDAILIGTLQTTAPFSIQVGDSTPDQTANIVIPAGSSQDIVVHYNPTALGPNEESLIINSDDPITPLIIVTLTGTCVPVDNNDPVLPVITTLKGNYPNPFNPETTISFSVKENVPVTIEIYNVKGQLVKTLVNEAKAPGNHTVVWKGEDNNGRSVSSGIFFYKMQAGKYTSTRKMILMK